MRHFVFASATLAVLGFAATVSPAQADNYYGPVKVGDKCWTRQGHNSLGYWTACKKSAGSNDSTARRNGSRR